LFKKLIKLKLYVFSDLLLLGIVAAGIVAVSVAFIFPLNVYAEISGLIISGLGFVLNWQKVIYFFSFEKYYYGQSPYFIFWLVLLLSAGSLSPFILDYYGYYIPTTTVLDANGITKGIVNLQMVLGQNSFWHILQAFTNETFDFYTRINIFLVFVFLLFVYETKRFVLLFFIPLFFLFVQSPSPDLPVFIISIIVCYKVIWQRKTTSFGFLLGVSVFAFAIKPTVFWLPIFVSLVGLRAQKINIKDVIVPVIIAVLFFSKNFISSGNVVFPIGDFYTNVDWQPHASLVERSIETAKLKTYDLQYTIEEINQFSLFEKIMNWFNLNGIKKIVHFFIAVCSLSFLGFSIWKKNTLYVFLFVTITIKILVVFWFSGQYRFMLDGILVFIAILLLHLDTKKIKFHLLVLMLSLVFTVGLCLPIWIKNKIPSFRLGTMMQSVTPSELWKPSIYSISDISENTIGNLKFSTPNNYPYLLDTPFPAISVYDLRLYYEHGIFPQWNKDVLYIKVLSTEERESLKSVLGKYELP